MSLFKKLLIAIGFVLIVIQFIQPALNKSDQLPATDISKTVSISDSVHAILKNACYDCHSNNTNYPWYSNIQPVGWLIASHIKNGREELNFSEFGNYPARRQRNKLTGISNEINDNEMPLSSYKLMHKNARLNSHEKIMLVDWAEKSATDSPER